MTRWTYVAIAVAVAAPLTASTPTWAKTAYQLWAQGRGVYVSSKDHPPELFNYFMGGPAYPVAPPPVGYYEGQPAFPAYPYGGPAY